MKARRPLPHLLWPLLLGLTTILVHAAPDPGHSPAEDRIDQLTELATRRHIKPYELLRTSAGEYPSERLIFHDVTSGTVIWKLSHNPGYNYHTYSNLAVWNLDGSRLFLTSTRPDRVRNWLVTPDGGRWSPYPTDDTWTYWSELNKDQLIYTDPKCRIYESNVATGETRQLWDLSQEPGELKLFRPSHDGKKFVVRQTHIPVGSTTHSFALVLNADGSGPIQRIDLGREVAQVWFLKRADHSFTFNEDTVGAERSQWMCEPEKNGAIHKITTMFYHPSISPLGMRAVSGQARTPKAFWITDLDTGSSRPLTLLSEPESQTGGGHFSWEVDEKWVVGSIGNAIYEMQVDSGQRRLLCIPNTQHSARTESEPESSPDGTKVAYNSTMLGDCDAYIAVQKLPDPPRNIYRQSGPDKGRILTWDPPEHARELAGYAIYHGTEFLTDLPITQRRYEVPDEKESYTVVAVERSGLQSPCPDHQPPPAPSVLTAIARSPFVLDLTWQASAANDVSYYNVYSSTGATAATAAETAPVQKNQVASPTGTHLLDWGLQQATPYTYVVTAVDRAGNESAPSAPFTVQTPVIQRRVFQHLALDKPLGQTPLEVSFDLPQDDHYLFWIELQGEDVPLRQTLRVAWDGARPAIDPPLWDYVATGHDKPSSTPFFDTLKSDNQCNPWYEFKAGPHRLTLAMPGAKGKLLSLTVTNDAGYVPDGITSFRNSH